MPLLLPYTHLEIIDRARQDCVPWVLEEDATLTEKQNHPEAGLIAEVLIGAGIEQRRPEELAWVFATFSRRLPHGLSRREIELEFRRQTPGLGREAGREDRKYYKRHLSSDAIFEDSNAEDDECD